MRKSLKLRTSQAVALKEAYEDASMADDYRYRFINDMCTRLSRGKALTKKQRSWLDNLIDEGVPAPKGDLVMIQ